MGPRATGDSQRITNILHICNDYLIWTAHNLCECTLIILYQPIDYHVLYYLVTLLVKWQMKALCISIQFWIKLEWGNFISSGSRIGKDIHKINLNMNMRPRLLRRGVESLFPLQRHLFGTFGNVFRWVYTERISLRAIC